MAETPLTPLETIRAAGLDADIHMGFLRIWPKQKFTENLYQYVTNNQAALVLEVVADWAVKRPDLDACGHLSKGIHHSALVVDEYLWRLNDTIRAELNCPTDPDAWRPSEAAHGRGPDPLK